MRQASEWPVLTTYDQNHLRRIALPLGGIGTGTVSLGGRGDLRDWEIMNRPAKGFTPHNTFFALYARERGGNAVCRALEGAIEQPYEGQMGCTVPNHSLPRFRKCSFEAAYPFGQALLSDPDVPVGVRIQAFNPLIPSDAEASGIPIAVLRFVLTNPGRRTVEASVCGNIGNFIGKDGGGPKDNVNEFRQSKSAGLSGALMSSRGVDPRAEQFGTIALATTAHGKITSRTAWAKLNWGDSLLDFWDDFSGDGELEDREREGVDAPTASLAVKLIIPPKSSRSVTFLIAWHFPNRMTWTPAKDKKDCCAGDNPDRIGNYYATLYADAWDVAEKTAPILGILEKKTMSFVRSVCDSDLPDVIKEAALYNLTALRSQTSFRTEDGRFFGWEGCCDGNGCCHGSCTHVWNYEQATAFLFGGLSCSMRDTEFAHATDDNGLMSFRVHLPIARAKEFALAAADGQMGTIMRLYRDWQLSGDDAMLRRLWPHAKRAMEFCWIPGGWDSDRDGVMEGCQHNTMDVEYYGPNPQMGGWYLGALRAAERMAARVGDAEFSGTCRELGDRGSRWMDANLFNGDYYEHIIIPPKGVDAIAKGLRHESMGARNLAAPELQLGAGCLVDQLVGQFMAHVCGLGYLLDQKNARRTLAAIMKFNFRKDLHGHFNHLRSFAVNDESALLMASYPKGRRPKRPFPYYNEVMTGFEYAAAVHMLYEGQIRDGMKCIAAIRDRYDGARRSPFNEAECGHHYARAMASWAAILALTGFHYSGVEKRMEFAPVSKGSSVFPWSNGYAWGTFKQTRKGNAIQAELRVMHGVLELSEIALRDFGKVAFDAPRRIMEGKPMRVKIKSL
ncbi:MAG TPA: GH116 family glycosyl-hydrolase [Candidatus Brocadiia bacterium]|nr:GH116 family glycosyl-hydrolase [Candidatus Brocadiia bacterium]